MRITCLLESVCMTGILAWLFMRVCQEATRIHSNSYTHLTLYEYMLDRPPRFPNPGPRTGTHRKHEMMAVSIFVGKHEQIEYERTGG